MNKYRAITAIGFLVVLLFTACGLGDSKVNESSTEEAIVAETIVPTENSVESDATETEEVEEVEVATVPEKTVEELAQEQLAAAIALRDVKDALNKEEDGEFYVPLPTLETIEDLSTDILTVEAKGLYVTGNIAGFKFDEDNIALYSKYITYISGNSDEAVTAAEVEGVNRLEQILAICDASEVNALVIDVKNDDGYVKWDSDIAFVDSINSDVSPPFKDYEPLMTYMDEHDIYAIARVVSFKDSVCAEAKPDHTIQLNTGGVYRDRKGVAWVNPFDPFIWEYIVAVSKEAALRGFDEIQYDYVRFPANAKTYNPITNFPNQNDRTKDEAIEDFLMFANDELADYNVHISVDVFAQLTRSWDDHPEDIGQTWRKMALQSDYICPMIYPSHYGPGVYGFDVPDQHPYEVVYKAMGEAMERNSAQENPAAIRAWIQGFNAPWIKGNIDYDAAAIAEQIKAIRAYGIQEYIIWDAKNTYDPMIFFLAEDIAQTLPNKDVDVSGRTAEEALKRYLTAYKYDRISQLYLLLPKDKRVVGYDDFLVSYEASPVDIQKYTVNSVSYLGGEEGLYSYEASVDLEFTNANGEVTLTDETYMVTMEDGVFKIHEPDLMNVKPVELAPETEVNE